MRWLRRMALALVSIAVVGAAIGYGLLRGSLPTLDGEQRGPVAASVRIERDAQGVATITAANRVDLAFATGYAHAQDRFFQMDLLRRAAAGELAALIGPPMIDTDKRLRRHNFRNVARQVIGLSTPREKQIVDAYTAGVNAGLESLSVRPFEYLVLNTAPLPWTAEDCVLIAYAMYIDLNDSDGALELMRARLYSALPPAVFEALYPRGTMWDATLDGVDLSPLGASIPGADVVDLRKAPTLTAPPKTGASKDDFPGSNNWALAGHRTADGGALIANDMHLGLRVPHIWYRARLVVTASAAAAREPAIDLAGVTLPGLPLFVAGSNGRIAWGYTNTHGDYDDLVIVATDEQHPNQYRNGDQWLTFTVRDERIDVRGGEAVNVQYRDTIWGPLLDETLDDKPLALAWTAQRPEATNLRQMDLETATSVEQAIAIANTAGIPVQNFVVADAQGNIGWTLIGQVPTRRGFDGQLPRCWGCEADVGWDGWLESKRYPRIVNPPTGQLATANSRTLGGPEADLIGDEGMDRGARTKQIRDGLIALDKATPRDMLSVALDDRALFLKRWRDILINFRDPIYLREFPARREALVQAEHWTGNAGVDDPGYRVVRAFRTAVQEDIYNDLIAAARARYPDATFRPSARFEDTAWRIMTTQPAHLLNPQYPSWDMRVMASLDRALVQLQKDCGVSVRKLSECTWGRRNTLRMQHPLADALPLLGRSLRMPREPLPGDQDMPRVQGVGFGASERFAVSPGREAQGYFHMPGGQSGHPLSPYFRAGHDAWVKGEFTPFLPGATQHTLTLLPREN